MSIRYRKVRMHIDMLCMHPVMHAYLAVLVLLTCQYARPDVNMGCTRPIPSEMARGAAADAIGALPTAAGSAAAAAAIAAAMCSFCERSNPARRSRKTPSAYAQSIIKFGRAFAPI